MPHTGRRKQPKSVKKQQVTTDDGWTHVSYASSPARARELLVRNEVHGWKQVDDPEVKIDDLVARYERCLRQYQTSEFHAQVQSLLDPVLADVSPGAKSFTSAVALALGSFVRIYSNNFWQLAYFKTVAETIGKKQGDTLPIIAYDPAFTVKDTGFLERLGIAVHSQAPEYDEHAFDGTFLFVPFLTAHVEIMVYLAAAQRAVLYVTPSMKAKSEYLGFYGVDRSIDQEAAGSLADGAQATIDLILQTHHEMALPTFEHDGRCFMSMTMYYAKPIGETSIDYETAR